MNATIAKFGHPASLIAETAHWLVLLRPAQPTLGALVVAAKSEALAFGALPAHCHADLAEASWRVEAMLAQLGTSIYRSADSLRDDSLAPGSGSERCGNRGFSGYRTT